MEIILEHLKQIFQMSSKLEYLSGIVTPHRFQLKHPLQEERGKHVIQEVFWIHSTVTNFKNSLAKRNISVTGHSQHLGQSGQELKQERYKEKMEESCWLFCRKAHLQLAFIIRLRTTCPGNVTGHYGRAGTSYIN